MPRSLQGKNPCFPCRGRPPERPATKDKCRTNRTVEDARPYKIASPLAFNTCHACWQKLRHSIIKVHLTSLVALCSVAKEQFPKAQPLADFLSYFLCSATKKVHHKLHSSARAERAQYERPAPNSLKNLTKPLKISLLPIDFSTLLC